ncbi:MAG: adenylylsulfate reductase [Peptococcaceae bacterium BRH_c4b]|nr:MAG: adenylylsulfate reductase [Peptococcaceae bacterium BRH_c4b]
MPAFIIAEKCDGCKGQDKTACMYACPNDLMVLDKEIMKAYNRDTWACWECLCCGKACPQQAIDLRGYADFVPLGATCTPLRGSDNIMWTIKFRNGSVKRFKFPIRTTEEGSAVPDGGFANEATLESIELYTEPASLGAAIWTYKK